MPLVDLWKTAPEQLRGKTVQQILAFAGTGKLLDGNDTSIEFREFLAYVTPEILSDYVAQCLASSFHDSGLALQDLVNQIGRRLGFRVESGRYHGSSKHLGFDGLWHSPDGDSIIIEVKTTDAYRLSLDVAANYRRQLIQDAHVTENKSSILYVVGRDDTGDLEAQVRGSRHAWDIRLISVEALLRLLRVKVQLEDQNTMGKMRDILMPQEFTRVDGIIDLVFSATAEVEREAISDDYTEEVEVTEQIPTALAFRSACVERLQKHFKEVLIRQTAATYVTPDDTKAVLRAVSRTYSRSQGVGYWFAFGPKQKQSLEEYKDPWVSLGCGSAANILLFPLSAFDNWLPQFNKTETDTGFYWHLHVGQRDSDWVLDTKRGYDDINVTTFLLPDESTSTK